MIVKRQSPFYLMMLLGVRRIRGAGTSRAGSPSLPHRSRPSQARGADSGGAARSTVPAPRGLDSVWGGAASRTGRGRGRGTRHTSGSSSHPHTETVRRGRSGGPMRRRRQAGAGRRDLTPLGAAVALPGHRSGRRVALSSRPPRPGAAASVRRHSARLSSVSQRPATARRRV